MKMARKFQFPPPYFTRTALKPGGFLDPSTRFSSGPDILSGPSVNPKKEYL